MEKENPKNHKEFYIVKISQQQQQKIKQKNLTIKEKNYPIKE
jgi:hypothetical protein